MFDKLVKEMVEKGLLEVAQKDDAVALNRLYQQLKILNYTGDYTRDMFTAFLRKYREN